MKPYNWREVIESFPCPTCLSGPGEHCITTGGHPKPEPHADRARDAERCRKCGARLHAEQQPGDLCARCELVRSLEVERSTYHRRRT